MADRLSLLFHASHGLDRSLVHSLHDDELNGLKSIVRGNRTSLERVRALEALAMRRLPDFPEIATTLLARPFEDVAVRASAATLLARWTGPSAEPALIAAVPRSADPVVSIKLAAALAHVGRQPSLAALAPLLGSPDQSVQRQAEFAVSVIGHRLGLSEHVLRAPQASALAGAPQGGLTTFTLQPAGATEYSAVVQHVTPADAFGVPHTAETAFTIRCGRTTSVLLLDPSHLASLGQTAMRRPLLAAVVADRADVDGSYSVARTVLVGPLLSGSFYVAIHRLDGVEVHFGSGHVEEGTVHFKIESLIAAGAPVVDVRGTISGRRVELQRAVSSAPAAAPNAPHRHPPPTRK